MNKPDSSLFWFGFFVGVCLGIVITGVLASYGFITPIR